MKKYLIRIQGNDEFFTELYIFANNIEIAFSNALLKLDAYSTRTIEKLEITLIQLEAKRES